MTKSNKIPWEYIWIDGTKPTPKLRSKTRIAYNADPWSFDGSSTSQAKGRNSDCILFPRLCVSDPLRNNHGMLVLCDVWNYRNYDECGPPIPTSSNFRQPLVKLECDNRQEYLFGFEQEYTMFYGRDPLGWPNGGYPAPQGPSYCGIGADEVFGRQIIEQHMWACLSAGLEICGTNAEVMPGQWEFQIGPLSPHVAADHIWLARFLLYRIAERYGVTIKLHPKPIGGDWNGAGMHTNFSTGKTRKSLLRCENACMALGKKFVKSGFPECYGKGYKERLTGDHETCSYKNFRYGIADRTTSVRIPKHVHMDNGGYIEDRRPCANADPYRVAKYIMEATLEC